MTEIWAVLDGYGYDPIKVTRETAVTVFYLDAREKERKTLNAFSWRGTKDQAKKLSQQLRSSKAEQERLNREVRVWFNNRVAELTEHQP